MNDLVAVRAVMRAFEGYFEHLAGEKRPFVVEREVEDHPPIQALEAPRMPAGASDEGAFDVPVDNRFAPDGSPRS